MREVGLTDEAFARAFDCGKCGKSAGAESIATSLVQCKLASGDTLALEGVIFAVVAERK